MHPPLVMLMRKVLRDFEHGGHVVPAGELALVSPALAHRLPDVFRDPDRYDPDRFGPGRQGERATRYSLIAFGGGRHGCMGSTFAYQQIKMIWSILLRASTGWPSRPLRFPITPPSSWAPGRRAGPATGSAPRAARGERPPGSARDSAPLDRALRRLHRWRRSRRRNVRVVPRAPAPPRAAARQGAVSARQAVRGRGDRERPDPSRSDGGAAGFARGQRGPRRRRGPLRQPQRRPRHGDLGTPERAIARDRHQAGRAGSAGGARRRRRRRRTGGAVAGRWCRVLRLPSARGRSRSATDPRGSTGPAC